MITPIPSLRVRMPTALRFGLGLVLTLHAFISMAADSALLEALPVEPGTIVATLGNQQLTAQQLLKADPAPFDKLAAQTELRRTQLQNSEEQARSNLLRERVEAYLDKSALEAEAKSRHTTATSLLADIKVAPVTEKAMQAFYEENRWRLEKTYEQVHADIEQYLSNRSKVEATRRFYDALRAKYHIVSDLPPYRVNVTTAGPVRGKLDAPITIVEFGDFQCPYCKRAEQTLATVLAKYPKAVRLVFRNFPLEDIHDHAAVAATAAVCADRQGKFWPMHDAMYLDQAALSELELKNTAQRLGLEMSMYVSCLSDPSVTAAIAADVRIGNGLNVVGTPYFLINGRPIGGSVPAEKFEAIIDDELERLNPQQKTRHAGANPG